MSRFKWSEEHDKYMKALFDKGHTAAHVAQALGCSRNAVIGRCLRAGIKLKGGARKSKAFKEAVMAAVAEAYEPAATPLPPQPSGVPLSKGIPLLELTSRTCRWAFGDKDFTFCGHEITHGQFCTHHARLAYIPVISGASRKSVKRTEIGKR